MIDKEKIRAVVEEELKDSKLFAVDIQISAGNEIEIVIDSDDSVDIDDCVKLSQAVESKFDREEEDFELTVCSAGIGQPLKMYRQYRKLIGQPVEVTLNNGTRIIATLQDAEEHAITLSYKEARTVEGKKKKQIVDVVNTYALSEIKTTKEYLDFK